MTIICSLAMQVAALAAFLVGIYRLEQRGVDMAGLTCVGAWFLLWFPSLFAVPFDKHSDFVIFSMLVDVIIILAAWLMIQRQARHERRLRCMAR